MKRVRLQAEKEAALVEKIQQSDKDAFKELFDHYYAPLCFYACKIIGSPDQSRDIVQDVYIKIWDNRKELVIYKSLRAYLYQAVRNQSLNHLEKRRRELQFKEPDDCQKRIEHMHVLHVPHQNHISDNELSKRIWELVEELPEKRKSVFILYRKHRLSYSEIADIMGITRKTVENQMGKALKFLRNQLI